MNYLTNQPGYTSTLLKYFGAVANFCSKHRNSKLLAKNRLFAVLTTRYAALG